MVMSSLIIIPVKNVGIANVTASIIEKHRYDVSLKTSERNKNSQLNVKTKRLFNRIDRWATTLLFTADTSFSCFKCYGLNYPY